MGSCLLYIYIIIDTTFSPSYIGALFLLTPLLYIPKILSNNHDIDTAISPFQYLA